MKKLILVVLVVGAWSFIFGTGTTRDLFGNGNTVQGTGDVVHRPLSVDAFHGITLQGSMDVMITPSAEQSVEIVAQQNIAELITVEVHDGIWTIATLRGSVHKEFTVHIHVPVMDNVKIEGSGDVKGMDMFTTDNVELKVEGSGDIDMQYQATSVKANVEGSGDILLRGSCTDMTIAIEGSGDIDTRGMQCMNARTSIAGSGDISVNAIEDLHATIAGSGSVRYIGSPKESKSPLPALVR